MSEYSYSAFGLNIRSDVEFVQFPSAPGVPDVHIRLGPAPDRLENPSGEGILYQITPSRFLLNIGQVARYLVSDGNEIIIDPAPEADFAAIRLFLFGSAFGALLHQRGILPLHASAIVTPRGAVLFGGQSGIGKSALACAFYRKGYPVLADEVCVIDTSGAPMVMPGYPYLMLWADTLRELGVDASGLQPARPEIRKYILPLAEGFATRPVPLHAIYILDVDNAGLSAPATVKGLRNFEAVSQNVYRPDFVDRMNIRTREFRQIGDVARHSRVSLVNRPASPFPVGDLVDLLERDFNV